MTRLSKVLASLVLAVLLMLWGVPGLVASNVAHAPPLLDALAGLIDAEAEALNVAGLALDDPRTPRLGERADQARARLVSSLRAYLEAVHQTFNI